MTALDMAGAVCAKHGLREAPRVSFAFVLMRALLFVFVMLLLFGGCARDQLRGAYGCPEYQLVCGGVCTDVSTNPAHCGACDTACSATEECSASRCRPACEDPRTLCADGCVNTESDVDNCGACGNECAPGARCREGECSATGCPPGQTRCGDGCVDTSSDANHCGECFAACDDGMRCDDNLCVDGCGSEKNCGGSCVDVTTDRENCGDCSQRCDRGELCFNGACSETCPEGLVRCEDKCVDLATDDGFCGACETSCILGAYCIAGECQCGGEAGALCNGNCVDLASDPANCGSCGVACPDGCFLGVCCASPNVMCGDECVDVETSAEHCGGCFRSCLDGDACSNGRCPTDCEEGFVLCGTECLNLDLDPNNCGECGVQCGVGESCTAGACGGGECQAPAIACGNACVDPRTDPNNCGSCDLVCAEGWVCRAGECRDPALGCDFGNLEFPVVLNGSSSVGDLTIDEACNLYVALTGLNASSGVVYSVSSATGMATVIAELPKLVRGLVYRPEDGLLYGTYPDRLIRLQPDGTGLEVLDESVTGEYLNGMTLAPANWGQRDGHLVVAKDDGEIVSYDPEDPVPEVFATTEHYISDVVFDGPQLYIAAYSSMLIQRVTPGGVVSDFVDLPCGPDGLAVEAGERLFAACGDTGEVYAIDIDTRDFELVGKLTLSGSWAPTALLWNNYALFAVEETTGLNALFP